MDFAVSQPLHSNIPPASPKTWGDGMLKGPEAGNERSCSASKQKGDGLLWCREFHLAPGHAGCCWGHLKQPCWWSSGGLGLAGAWWEPTFDIFNSTRGEKWDINVTKSKLSKPPKTGCRYQAELSGIGEVALGK